jgi:hypothetical protein
MGMGLPYISSTFPPAKLRKKNPIKFHLFSYYVRANATEKKRLVINNMMVGFGMALVLRFCCIQAWVWYVAKDKKQPNARNGKSLYSGSSV